MSTAVDQVAEVLRNAAETHHRVYRIVDGADDDWASWYADWLIRLSPLPKIIGSTPVPSELVWLLVDLDKRYAIDRPTEPWENIYAARILAHFPPTSP